MGAVGALLGLVLLLFELILIARVVVDWVEVASRGPEPQWRRQARRITHTITEPVLAPVRRVLPPVRTGSVAFDLAVPVVFIAVLLLRVLVGGL
jgi:YggT family protein